MATYFTHAGSASGLKFLLYAILICVSAAGYQMKVASEGRSSLNGLGSKDNAEGRAAVSRLSSESGAASHNNSNAITLDLR